MSCLGFASPVKKLLEQLQLLQVKQSLHAMSHASVTPAGRAHTGQRLTNEIRSAGEVVQRAAEVVRSCARQLVVSCLT